jgi:hypothetical protein
MTFTPIDGPMLIEDTGSYERYRQLTLYHIASGVATVKSGKRGIDPYLYPVVEENVSHLPPEVAINRLEIMIRAINSATGIFQQIGSGDIAAQIQREAPVYE